MHSQDKETIIALRDVSVRFETGAAPVIDNVSFQVNKGDFIAITGPNGGGKTTLLRVMLKLMKPTSGTVEYLQNGHVVKKLKIGYLPQKSNIDTHFPITAGQVVRSGLLHGWFGKETEADRERFRQIAELVGITDYLDRRIGALSGGQLQRTLLGRALMSDPDILMLDEPLSYVDKNFEQQIYSLVADLSKTKTIVLITHEMSIISGMATRHIIVDHGIHECSASRHYVESDCD